MVERAHLSAVSVLFLVLVICSCSLNGQSLNKTSVIPGELTPSDSDIRSFLGTDDNSCKPANGNEWNEKLQKALQIAENRGLVGDRALIEASLGSTLIAQGNSERAFAIFKKALQDSIESKRSVLQADILISLASQSQMTGDVQGAIDLVNRALMLAERTGNLYGKARALGELGQLQLQTGKHDEASTLIDQALDIDRLNGYKYEARHLLYKSIYLGLVGEEEKAIQLLVEARARAVATNDIMTFVQAEDTYAFGLVKKGKADEAIRQMDLFKKTDLSEFIEDASTRACFASYIRLPLLRLIWLEGFANVLEAADQKEKEVEIWAEVFSTSQVLGLLAGQAEAKEKAANLESQLKRNEAALKDYALAVELYRKLGSETLVNRAEISESVLLVNLGRGREAISVVEEIASHAKRLQLRQLEFRAYVTLSGIYQSSGETLKARDALEQAKSLVHPRPFDGEIDNKSVHLAYVSLADIYRKLQIPSKELVSIDQAFFVSLHLKDEEAQHGEVIYLDQRIRDLRIREAVEQRQNEGQLIEALIY
jgi:tetratricopeptide (TPR) repeat protein